MERKAGTSLIQTMIQGPHCIADFMVDPPLLSRMNRSHALQLVNELAQAMGMKKVADARIIEGHDRRLSIYQIVSTSHIIVHYGSRGINADLFSCEPFDVGVCVSILTRWFGTQGNLQYCQRNLSLAPGNTTAIPMGNLNTLTGNPHTFTHALVNWFSGDEKRLGDAGYGTDILKKAVKFLAEDSDPTMPAPGIWLEKIDPIPQSWDLGGFSGGYVNLMKQLTMHTFLGINAAYTDIMGYTFNLQEILQTLQEGFKFSYFEVDGIFQRIKMDHLPLP